MQEISQHIAERLRTLRRAEAWSLDRTARETGVSKAMLGQIERGESSPTVATLWKIASGFRVPFSGLFEPEAVAPDAGVAGAAHQAAPASEGDAVGMSAVPLFAFDPVLGFELLVGTLAAGAVSESAPHAPGVVEHLVVVEGELEVRVDGVWRRLTAGEGLRFAADRPHAYRNPGSGPVRFHDVIHYPRGAGVTPGVTADREPGEASAGSDSASGR
ncbi:XRE family transcriptional regulator [Halomonas sp. ND22Bw]|uniref:XRE family transcriptional regulator n=1 Tax=Halomonas salina TaxID=42565 RepID=A0ABR4WSN4_9GAMM|nr:XRE family transcriptional regulator [Halomonas salina]KGE77737.1 XRE family transcriptional regulator [Halomonas salina]PSJ21617.1 XRE family transcriptional regulator [Halomonas sp. ND22Bw]